jgi:hypothetical protein
LAGKPLNLGGTRVIIRNPILDFYTGALLALGGPMSLMLPQRLFLAMMTPPEPLPTEPVEKADDLA